VEALAVVEYCENGDLHKYLDSLHASDEHVSNNLYTNCTEKYHEILYTNCENQLCNNYANGQSAPEYNYANYESNNKGNNYANYFGNNPKQQNEINDSRYEVFTLKVSNQ